MLVAVAQTARPTEAGPMPRGCDKHSYASHDGMAIFYRHWPGARGGRRDAVVLLHREHEHSGRLQYLVDELALDGCDFFAWDARGHGCSPGARGDAASAGVLVKDLDCFLRHIQNVRGIAPERTHIVAQGAAGVIAAAWTLDYAPRIGSLTLAAAAFECKGLAARAPGALRALYRRRGNLAIRTYARPDDLTQDRGRQADYANDRLIGTTTSARLLIDLQNTARRVAANAWSIEAPTLVMIAGRDRLVRRQPQIAFHDGLGTVDKTLRVFENALHDILGEADRASALAEVRRFILRRAERARLPDEAQAAEAGGIRRLSLGGETGGIGQARLAAARASLRALGRLSAGVRLALDAGLESCAVAEYVSRDRAQGSGALGRVLDRQFLESLPVRSLRARGSHLKRAILGGGARLRATGLPVRLVAIGSNLGTQVLDAIQALPELPASVLLHEQDREGADRCLLAIRARGLKDIAVCRHVTDLGGAWFASLAAFTTLAVAALHDGGIGPGASFEDLLCGLARAVPAGGCLVYTAGPHRADWHRQAAALGAPPAPTGWRHQADLDRCMQAAGFRPLERWVDDWGCFSVTLSVRAGAEGAVERFVLP